MIISSELRSIASEKLTDAEILLQSKRFDSAVYLCGYCIEIALKYRICKTLNWSGFPSTSKEFEKLKSIRTHDLDVLLSFTGLESQIKSGHIKEWSTISAWNPEVRYQVAGSVDELNALKMIKSVKIIMALL
jgi:hypothetical protein